MSVLQYNFRSVVLGMETRMVVTIPSIPEFKAFSGMYKPKDGKKTFGFGGTTVENAYPKGVRFPTLYLCHGGSGDCMSYLVNTNVARYANDRLLMTVCVDLEESFACDMVYGKKYFTYLTEEVPALVQCLFPSSEKREDNFIAGFSMGAHAALKAALRCPEKYAAVWAMSGAKDMVKMRKMAAEMGMSSGDTEFWAFGSRVPEDTYGTENDLLYLAEQLGRRRVVRYYAFFEHYDVLCYIFNVGYDVRCDNDYLIKRYARYIVSYRYPLLRVEASRRLVEY